MYQYSIATGPWLCLGPVTVEYWSFFMDLYSVKYMTILLYDTKWTQDGYLLKHHHKCSNLVKQVQVNSKAAMNIDMSQTKQTVSVHHFTFKNLNKFSIYTSLILFKSVTLSLIALCMGSHSVFLQTMR